MGNLLLDEDPDRLVGVTRRHHRFGTTGFALGVAGVGVASTPDAQLLTISARLPSSQAA